MLRDDMMGRDLEACFCCLHVAIVYLAELGDQMTQFDRRRKVAAGRAAAVRVVLHSEANVWARFTALLVCRRCRDSR